MRLTPTAKEKFFRERMKVVGGQTVAHAVDGTHQRRDEHGPDDHCRRVHIESHGGHHNGKHQHPEVGATENDPALDVLMNDVIPLHFAAQIEPLQQLLYPLLHRDATFRKSTKKKIPRVSAGNNL
jgi:hypothetical protein